MKKFLISSIVVLMSVAASAQAKQINTDKVLEALLAAPASASAVNVDSGESISLASIMAPLKSDLANGIATGVSLGDDGGTKKRLQYVSLECSAVTDTLANCTLAMNGVNNDGAVLKFDVNTSADGSMKLFDSMTVQKDH